MTRRPISDETFTFQCPTCQNDLHLRLIPDHPPRCDYCWDTHGEITVMGLIGRTR